MRSPIAPSDYVGRHISEKSKLPHNGKIRWRTFFQTTQQLSVDRLDVVSNKELAALADQVLPDGRTLLGWAQILVSDVNKWAGPVVADPTLDNPYHAIIDRTLPAEDEERIAEARQQAHNLTLASTFRERSA